MIGRTHAVHRFLFYEHFCPVLVYLYLYIDILWHILQKDEVAKKGNVFFHKVFICNLGKTDTSGTKFLNVKLYYDLTRFFYWVVLINIGWSG